MPDATPRQVAKFEKIKKLGSAINQYAKAAKMRAETIAEGVRIGRENGVSLPDAISFISEVQNFQETDRKLQLIIGAVMVGDLGVRDSSISNDIDIMAPAGTTDDELIQYQLSGIPLIVIGVVVVYGIITVAYSQYHRAERIKSKYNEAKAYVDDRLCADPGSPQCSEWETFKLSPTQTARESLWDDIEQGARDLGQAVIGGTKWGLIVGIPLAVYLFARFLEKK